MSNTLVKGQRINLSNYLNEIKQVKIEISYEVEDSYTLLGSGLNFYAFCLTEDKKFISKFYLVNKNNNKTPDNGLNYYKSLNNENKFSFLIDFTRINSNIKRIIFALSLGKDIQNNSTGFKFLKNLQVKLISMDNIPFIEFDVPLDFSYETIIEIFEIYNKDFQWRAVANSYGYVGSLGMLTEKCGLQFEENNNFEDEEISAKKEKSVLNETVDKKLKLYREKLLDLSKRNPLINIKPKSLVEFHTPEMYEIFKRLVEENKTMTVSAIPEDLNLYVEQENEIITNKRKKELTPLLYRIRHRATSSMEEQGINILFVAFGLLTWLENEDSQDKFVSPIILVPVELTKDSLNTPYKMRVIEDDILVNPALNTKLINQFAVELPELPEELNVFSLNEYFLELQNLVKNIPGQKFEEKQCLGIFSFNKLILYKDLEEYSDLIKEHPILSGKGNINSDIKNIEDFKADKLDEKIASRDVFQVLDADSSQQEAIILAKKGVSFVLQGPPGTGKSQTITNIIAECISDGKSVLFVSEKMAALDVVKKRLENSGLGDFCLELHSNKTSKRQVISDLEKSLMLEHKKLKDNPEDELRKLDHMKNQLNHYIKTLHKPRGLMELSAYKVQSHFAKLQKIELLLFDIPDVLNLDKQTWEKINENLQKLSNLKTVFPDIENNPWKNINLESLTIEKETLIRKNIDDIINKSNDLIEIIKQYSIKTSLKELKNIDEIKNWFKAVDFIISTKKPVINWLKPDYDIQKLKEYTSRLSIKFKKYKDKKDYFLERYKKDIFNQNIIDGLKYELNYLIEFFGKNIPENYFSQNYLISEIFSDFKNYFDSFNNNLKIISEKLGIKIPETLIEIDYLQKLLSYIEKKPQLQEKWYDENFLMELLLQVDDIKVKSDNFLNRLTNFTKEYGKDILSLGIPALLKRFESDYKSILRVFNPVFKADMKHISDLTNKPGLKYIDALDILKNAEIVYKEKQWFDENKIEYFKMFGFYYKSENTDWIKLKEHIETSLNLVKWFSGKEIPESLKILLKEEGLELEKINQTTIRIKENYSGIKNTIEQLNEQYIKIIADSDLKLSDIALNIFTKQKYFNDLSNFFNKLNNFFINNNFFWNTLEDDFNKISETLSYEDNFIKLQLGKIYSQYFKEFETNWDDIEGIIQWTIDCRNRISSEKWEDLFGNISPVLKAISSDNELISILKNEKELLREKFNTFKNSFNEFISLFTGNELKISSIDINFVDFYYLNQWFVSLSDNFKSFGEWFVFKEIDTYFGQKGINGFIEKIIENKFSGYIIRDSFLKRFYQIWLDNIFKSELLLQNFNGNEHNLLIKDFARTDLKSLEISKARLQVNLRERIPKQDFFEMQSSEYGILNTEITKKRKHKSLRRLFGEIRNLLFNLKPCFMMSPLSVCQFIDPKKITFDLVVFDEASQIFPEDAVSAMLRAKQTIIVGDKRQMPPSNFFRFVESDENDEFNEDDVPEYESILDEFSNMGLPSRMLQWHYRSRNESLIAFSNKHFYQNRLWTFPDKNMDNQAIEFILTNGVYDRGGSRQNRIEAEKVASLVFEHFIKYQNKLSLGVITFSEAQQMTVLNEIEKKRMENQEFENLFESKDSEHFFVKSIEHVQGDERDVIFFSVGYGKDQNNKLSYFFGPLNQTGGERRLNVAITRARQHIKLVSSIDYNDIDPTRLNSKGSKLLRNYLEYAKRGKIAISEDLKTEENLIFDSPFEEHVYNELSNLGYTLRTQVGTSGYRIDLAIVDPDYPGRFLLGIECDGATYHSTKTARDRDRLRQQVLEGLGWKIHRIWSRDWVSDQKNEILKIHNAIQEAKKYNKTVPDFKKEKIIISDSLLYDTKKAKDSIQNNLKKYVAVDIGILGNSEEFYQEINTSVISNAIFKIVSNESPVSILSVTKRIFNAWNIGRTGQKNQKRIKSIISNLDEHIHLDKDGFLWVNEMETAIVRIPGEFRDLEEISKEEFAEASLFCLSSSFSAERDELIRVVANLFDFKRILGVIREKISQSIDLNLNKNIFIAEGNIIKINSLKK